MLGFRLYLFAYALVAQWIEQDSSKVLMGVRFPPGAQNKTTAVAVILFCSGNRTRRARVFKKAFYKPTIKTDVSTELAREGRSPPEAHQLKNHNPSAILVFISLGSSVVERYPEEVGVRCSIHRLGTRMKSRFFIAILLLWEA